MDIISFKDNEKIKPNCIVHGDCLEVMPKIESGSVDMILSDLPYGITSNEWDIVIPFEDLWENYWRVLKKNGIIALTASQPFSSLLTMSQLKFWKHEWIWIKNRGSNFANTVREPFKEHEQVLIFSRGKWTYNKQMQKRSESGLERAKYPANYSSKSKNYRDFEGRFKEVQDELRVPSSYQKFNCEVGLHPTQKPKELFKYLVRTYTIENEIVMDNCCGSGTTGIACQETNRKFILIEKDLENFIIATKRLKDNDPLTKWS